MKATRTVFAVFAASIAFVVPGLAQTVVSLPVSYQDAAPADEGRRSALRLRFDADRNGVLDREERLALQVAALSGDLPVPGRLPPEARVFRASVQHEYDVDQNGALDQWERLLLRWDLESGMIRPPRRASLQGASTATR